MSGLAAVLTLPPGTVVHDHQVAGHIFEDGRETIGMLKETQAGSILKAVNKPMCGRREIEFYERMQALTLTQRTIDDELTTTTATEGGTDDSNVALLRELIPEYRGTMQIQMNSETVSKTNDFC